MLGVLHVHATLMHEPPLAKLAIAMVSGRIGQSRFPPTPAFIGRFSGTSRSLSVPATRFPTITCFLGLLVFARLWVFPLATSRFS